MKKTVTFFAFALITLFGGPLSAQVTFNKTIFTSTKAIQQTTDHGYIVAGDKSGNIYLTKLDSTGNAVWGKEFVYDFPMDLSYTVASVQQTTDKGYIIGAAGYSGITVDDLFLLKTDSNGVMQWQKSYEKGPNNAYGGHTRQTTDGGYIAAGFWNGEICVVKTDNAGAIVWTNFYSGAFGHTIEQTTDGGYIITGYRDMGGVMTYDAVLVKLTGTGAVSWARTYGGNGREKGWGAIQAADGGYVMACSTDSLGASLHDALLVKTDGSGNVVWAKTYTGAGYDGIRGVKQTKDGGYILSGGTQTEMGTGAGTCLIRTDATGNMLWSKQYGDSYSGGAVQETADGGFITNTDMASIVKTSGDGTSCNKTVLTTNTGTATTTTIVGTFTPVISAGFIPFSSQMPVINSPANDSDLCPPVTEIVPVRMAAQTSVFPDPSTGNITITYDPEYTGGLFRLVDMTGNEVYSESIKNNNGIQSIRLPDASNSIYFYYFVPDKRVVPITSGKLSILR